jgi:hypothetical protein
MKILLDKVLISWSLDLYTMKTEVSKSLNKIFFLFDPVLNWERGSPQSFNIGPFFSEGMCVKLLKMSKEGWGREAEGCF